MDALHKLLKGQAPTSERLPLPVQLIVRQSTSRLIPGLSDHDRWAQSRKPMEVMCQG
jgi:hypothetical protein